MVRLAVSSRHSSSISCNSAMNSPFKQATLSNSSRKGYVVHIGSIYTRINAQTHAVKTEFLQAVLATFAASVQL